MNSSSSNVTFSGITMEYGFTVVLLSCAIALALFGNALVLVAFYRFHSLRTVTNYFIVSLAVADVLVASLSMPCWLYIRIGKISHIPRNNLANEVLYYSWQFIDILCSTASIISLCIISVDRWLAIKAPLVYHAKMTHTRALVSILAAWLSAVAYASLSLITLNRSLQPTAGQVYAVFISTSAFFLPLLVLVVVYGSIWRVALRQAKQIASTGVTASNQREERKRRTTFLRELKVTKTLGVVVGAFVVCWCPFFTIVMLYAICPFCAYDTFWVAGSKWLHYFNSTLNPIIYTALTKDVRKAFKRLLRCFFCFSSSRVTVEPTDAEFSLTTRR